MWTSTAPTGISQRRSDMRDILPRMRNGRKVDRAGARDGLWCCRNRGVRRIDAEALAFQVQPLARDAQHRRRLLEAAAAFAAELRRAGGTTSEAGAIRRFASYHLADLEGNDGGARWLAGKLLADEIRALVAELDR